MDFANRLTVYQITACITLQHDTSRTADTKANTYHTSKQWRQNEFESGGEATVQRKSGGGHQSDTKCAKKIFCRASPPFVSKSTISRFDERFRGVQYTV